MKTITVKLNAQEIQKLKSAYKKYPMRFDIQHTDFQIRGDDVVITVYKSGSVVFQGEGAAFHAMPYSGVAVEEAAKPTTVSLPMAGSDEVGTGDYFGPITVCAAYVDEASYAKLPIARIVDSKQINDDKIRELAPIIMDTIPYSLLVLTNHKYNDVHKTQNINVIKAKLHNKAYLNLSTKVSLPALSVIDQFMPKASYYKALFGEPEIVDTLVFETKAENKFIAVACGAIIARYAFLDTLDKMGEHYGLTFPKGAGKHVDLFGKEFVETFGQNELYNVAKVHFANTDKILNQN